MPPVPHRPGWPPPESRSARRNELQSEPDKEPVEQLALPLRTNSRSAFAYVLCRRSILPLRRSSGYATWARWAASSRATAVSVSIQPGQPPGNRVISCIAFSAAFCSRNAWSADNSRGLPRTVCPGAANGVRECSGDCRPSLDLYEVGSGGAHVFRRYRAARPLIRCACAHRPRPGHFNALAVDLGLLPSGPVSPASGRRENSRPRSSGS